MTSWLVAEDSKKNQIQFICSATIQRATKVFDKENKKRRIARIRISIRIRIRIKIRITIMMIGVTEK